MCHFPELIKSCLFLQKSLQQGVLLVERCVKNHSVCSQPVWILPTKVGKRLCWQSPQVGFCVLGQGECTYMSELMQTTTEIHTRKANTMLWAQGLPSDRKWLQHTNSSIPVTLCGFANNPYRPCWERRALLTDYILVSLLWSVSCCMPETAGTIDR